MPLKRITATGRALQAAAAIDSSLAVIRELIDNAIDAAATSIVVSIDHRTAGLSHISVTDNGHGVHPQDHPLVFTPSSISKSLDSDSDAADLGFRGEALHLISRVSAAVQITTKTKHDVTAFQWEVTPPDTKTITTGDSTMRAAHLPPVVKRVASPGGTSVVVKDLFVNTPARKKMLMKKSTSAEINSIETLLKQYAIAHIPIRFSLKTVTKIYGFNELQSSTRFITPPHQHTATNLLSHWTSQHMTTFTTLRTPTEVQPLCQISLTCAASAASAGTSAVDISPLVCVNRRLMKTTFGTGRSFKRAFMNKYNNMKVEHSRVPVWMVFVQVPKNQVDVNIEPKKDDVFLKNHDLIVTEFEKLVVNILERIVSHGKLTDARITPVRDPGNASIAHGADSNCLPLQIAANLACNKLNTPTLIISSDSDSDPKETSETISVTADESWTRNMHDRLSSEGDEPDAHDATGDTSLGEDEDFVLAKDNTISNPFTLMAMKCTLVPISPSIADPVLQRSGTSSRFRHAVPNPPPQHRTSDQTKPKLRSNLPPAPEQKSRKVITSRGLVIQKPAIRTTPTPLHKSVKNARSKHTVQSKLLLVSGKDTISTTTLATTGLDVGQLQIILHVPIEKDRSGFKDCDHPDSASGSMRFHDLVDSWIREIDPELEPPEHKELKGWYMATY